MVDGDVPTCAVITDCPAAVWQPTPTCSAAACRLCPNWQLALSCMSAPQVLLSQLPPAAAVRRCVARCSSKRCGAC